MKTSVDLRANLILAKVIASRPKFSTCDFLRVRLTRALHAFETSPFAEVNVRG